MAEVLPSDYAAVHADDLILNLPEWIRGDVLKKIISSFSDAICGAIDAEELYIKQQLCCSERAASYIYTAQISFIPKSVSYNGSIIERAVSLFQLLASPIPCYYIEDGVLAVRNIDQREERLIYSDGFTFPGGLSKHEPVYILDGDIYRDIGDPENIALDVDAIFRYTPDILPGNRELDIDGRSITVTPVNIWTKEDSAALPLPVKRYNAEPLNSFEERLRRAIPIMNKLAFAIGNDLMLDSTYIFNGIDRIDAINETLTSSLEETIRIKESLEYSNGVYLASRPVNDCYYIYLNGAEIDSLRYPMYIDSNIIDFGMKLNGDLTIDYSVRQYTCNGEPTSGSIPGNYNFYGIKDISINQGEDPNLSSAASIALGLAAWNVGNWTSTVREDYAEVNLI